MLVYSTESPCDKENRPPRGSANCFPGKNHVHSNLKQFIAPIDPSRILKTPLKGIRGNTVIMPSIEKDLLPVPKSIDFAIEGLDYGDCCRLNSTLSSKHAWIISSPNSDPKSCSVSSLPHLNSFGVSVDSPDITSKFYAKSPPLRNYSKDNDSPEVEASSLVLNETASIRTTGLSVPKTIRQRRISPNESPEHSLLSKVPSPQLGIYRGNQKMHFIHTTENESTPIATGNIVALDSPESLSKHTNDGNSNSSNSGITVTVTPVQRPSKLRGKTVLLKHLEIDERFFYKSPPSALNIEGEGSRNENAKKILSSPKSDGDLNARRLSSMENEIENGRSFIRNFERRTISDENRSKVRVFEGVTLDLKAGAKSSSVAVIRNHSTEQFINESSSYTMDSIGSALRGKLSLSPTASELHEKKEIDNKGRGGVINTTSMSRLKCDINSNGYGYGTTEGNLFKRTNSDTLNTSNSEVKDSRITDYSIERKNSKEKEYKSSHDNLSVKKRIMKPSPPLSQPPKSKEYVINKREHSPPIIDFSSPSPSHSSTENSVPAVTFVKNGRTYRSASLPNDEPQSVSPGTGRPRLNAPAHQNEQKSTCRERKDIAPTMYDNLANIRNIARMNGNIIKAKEPASRYPTSTSTITSTSTASTYVDPTGNNSNVLNRSGLYRKNITSKCNDACDLTRYSSRCDNYFIVPDSFELLKDFNLSETHTNNFNSNNSNGYNSNNSNYNSSNNSSSNNSNSINNNYAPRRIRISTAAVSKSYSRIKNPRRKRKGLSYYNIRGVSLDSIPENRELVEFNDYVQIKMKRSSHTTSDSHSMKHLK